MKPGSEGNLFVIRVERGEEIIGSILKLCEGNKIFGGTFTGIGAVERAELAHYDIIKKAYTNKVYDELLELTSLTGNVSSLDGKPYVHAHATLANNKMESIGGHLKSAVVGVTCEIFLTARPEIKRKYSEGMGVNLLEL